MNWLASKKTIIRPRTEAGDIFDFLPPKAIRPLPPIKAFLFFLIVLLWMSFGIFGRDPWKPEETLLSTMVLQMSEGGFVFNPLLLGQFFEKHPPLYLWIISFFARFTPLEIHEGARLANVVILSLAFYLIFYSTKKNYGIRVGWLSILLVIGTIGFLIRGHQLTFGIPALLGVSIVIYGFATVSSRQFHNTFSSLKSIVAISSGILFLLFSIGVVSAFAAMIAVCIHLFKQKHQRFTFPLILLIYLAISLWLYSDTIAYQPMNELVVLSPNFNYISHFLNYMTLAAWSLFPTLPLAAIAIWLQSKKNDAFFNFLITLSASLIFYTLLIDTNEENLFILLPSITILAARALQKTSDDTAYILDSFAFLVVGVLFVLGIWLFTIFTLAGWTLFSDLLTQSLGDFTYVPPYPLSVVIAVVLTLLWLKLLFRSDRSNERAIVNWSCGVTLVWILFCLLLLPSADARKSYRTVSTAVLQHTQDNCIEVRDVNPHFRSQLIYFGNTLGDNQCPFLLSANNQGNVVWQGGRINDKTVYLIKK